MTVSTSTDRYCGNPTYQDGLGYHGVCRACNTPSERKDLEEDAVSQPWPPKFVFVYDAYVRISAHSKADADERLAEVEQTVDAMHHCWLSTFDAYGVEDAETGEEIRQVD